MVMPSANYCPHCGAEAQGDSLFCSDCGRPIVGGSESSAPVPYLISPNRIILMTILSLGLYTVYWLYKTWKHYKEHTGARAYPVWHGLTAFVPIYASFRAHAHLRTFGELASAAGLQIYYAPRLAFGAMLVGLLRLFVAEGSAASLVVLAVSIVAQIWMMLHAQPRINYYWDHAYGSRLRGMSIGKGEIIVVIFGVVGWISTLSGIMSAS